MQQPTYSLEEVKIIAEKALEDFEHGKIRFSAISKSTNAVIEALRSQKKHLTQQRAAEYILYRLYDLSPDDFFKTEAGQWQDPTFVTDQYGVRYDNVTWFIKFRIEKDTGVLDQISFHPSTEDMTLANGNVLRR